MTRKKIIVFCFTILTMVTQGTWAGTPDGNWSQNRDDSWGSDYASATVFTISNARQLAQFAYMVNNGNSFQGKTVILDNDIDLSWYYWVPVGTSDSYSFKGKFLGAGKTISGMCINGSGSYGGLFGYISGLDNGGNSINIEGVKLESSTINGSYNYTGALVGYMQYANLRNCYVAGSVKVGSTATEGSGQAVATGGIAGFALNADAFIEGCFCAAQVLGTSNVGGLVGAMNRAKVFDCIYAGSSVTASTNTNRAYLVGRIEKEHNYELGFYLARNLYISDLTKINDYDTRGYGITPPASGVSLNYGSPEKTFSVSGITTYWQNSVNYNYDFKLDCNGIIYCPSGADFQFTAQATPGFAVDQVTATSSSNTTVTLTPVDGTYSLANITDHYTIAVTTAPAPWGGEGNGTAGTPYLVKTCDDLRWIAGYINNNNNTGDHYDGKYFKLCNDLTFDGTENNFTAIGNLTSNNHYFAGIFDGNHKTISGINIKATTGRQALFGTANGATIKDLTLTESTVDNTANSSAAGIVAYCSSGTNTIENCHVTSTVTVSCGGYAGGIVAITEMGTVNVTGCTSAATVSSSGDNYSSGGIVGSCGKDSSTETNSAEVTVSNCLYYGTSVSATGSGNIAGAIVGNYVTNSYSTVTFSNNYYTYPDATITGVGRWNKRNSSFTGEEILTFDLAAAHGAVRAHTVTGTEYDIEDLGSDGATYTGGVTAYANGIKYNDVYYSHVLALNDNADNTEVLSLYDDMTFDVKLRGRTLYKDGYWNTLCLPFDLSSLSNTIFAENEGCEISTLDNSGTYELEGENYSTGVTDDKLYLFFTKDNAIVAGKPYIVRWERKAGYNELDPAYDHVNPTFRDVTIKFNDDDNISSEDGKVTFLSTYSPKAWDYAERSILFVGAQNTLYCPAGTGNYRVGPFRAYFQLDGVQMAEEADENPSGGGAARAFVINIVNNEDAGVKEMVLQPSASPQPEAYYDLQGRQYGGKPRKGLYIRSAAGGLQGKYNGKKVIIK